MVTGICTPSADGADFQLTPVSEGELVQKFQEQQMVNVLASADDDSDGSFLDAIGLKTGWTYGPLAGMGVLTAVSNEWYVLNEETFVMMCLSGGGFLAWVLAREAVGDWYTAESKAILAAQVDAEAKHIAACQTFVTRAGGSATLDADVSAAFAEREALVSAEISAKAYRERAAVKADFQRRLEQLINQKADEENQMYKQLLADADAHAATAAEADGFKRDALAYAIKAITDPANAGPDPAGKLYKDFFASKVGIKW